MLLGLRLARELHAQGDRALFLAPAAHALLFQGTPFGHGTIDPVSAILDRALPDVIRAKRVDSVVLLDLMLVLWVLQQKRIDPAFLDRLPVPTIALDIWDLRRSDLRVDLCEAEMRLPDLARTVVPHRLVPVPFARPDTDGAYCALPTPAALDDRDETRSALGLGPDDRLVMLTTAQFQTRGLTPFQVRAVATIPHAIVAACRDCDPRVHVVHVGPQPLLEHRDRYQHLPQVPPVRFEQVMRAADLLVTPNQAATGITTALVLGVPPVAVIGETTEQRFRVFPLGLHSFMSPILQDNPYVDAVTTVDLAALRTILSVELFDERSRAVRREKMRAYVTSVQHLPTGGQVVGKILARFP